MLTIRAQIVGLLLACILLAPARAGEPSLASIGRAYISLGACDTPVVVRFSVRPPRKPVALRTEDGAPGRPAPVWSLTWDPPVAGDAALHEYSASGKFSGGCPGVAGETIPVSVRDGDGIIGILTIRVSQTPAAKLWAPSALSAVVTLTSLFDDNLPGLTIPVPVRETGGALSLPPVSLWVEPVKAADGSAAPFALWPGPAATVPPGGAPPSPMTVTATGKLTPGTYTTTLYIAYPGGGDPRSIPLTLNIHRSRGFLFAFVFAGVLLGLIVNQGVTVRLDLENARAAALRQARSLLGRVAGVGDPQLQQQLTRIAYTLQSAAEAATTVADVTAAQAAATADAAAADKTAADLSTAFQQALATQRAIYQPPTPMEPAVVERLSDPMRRLDGFAALAASGDVSDADGQLKVAIPALEAETVPVLQAWMAEVLNALQKLGDWAGSDFTAARDRLRTSASAAYGAASAETIVPAANQAAGELRTFAALTAPPAAAASFRAAALLAPDPLAMLLREQAQAADACAALPDPLAVIGRLSQIRGTVATAIQQVSVAAPVQQAIRQGDFSAAVQALPGARPIVAAAPVRVAAMLPTVPAVAAPLIVVAPRVVAPSRLRVGDTQTAMLVWPAGAAAFTGRITWSVQAAPGGPAAAPAAVTGAGPSATVRGLAAGFAILSASADSWQVDAPVAVADPLAEPALRHRREIRWLTWVLTGVTVGVTTGLGYSIFQQNWLGTFNDAFAAVVWGLLGQFGLERVRTAVQPILSKT